MLVNEEASKHEQSRDEVEYTSEERLKASEHGVEVRVKTRQQA
jgi:hypothetical protein